MRLGAIGAEMQAQLDGFKSRAMRAEAPASSQQRHLYVTEWRETQAAASPASEVARMLLLDDGVLRSELALTLSSGASRWPALVCAVATQRGRADRPALFAAEVVLSVVQAVADANTAAAPVVLLLTRGAQLPHGELGSTYGTYGSGITHAGVWGLARSVRSEAQLPVRCIDGALSRSKEVGLALSEPEAVVLGNSLLVPRLSHAPSLGRPTRSRLGGAHVVSGGTNGLGLLTGRWVAQRGASAVVLSSRSGGLADGTASEWEQLVASGCVAMVVQCDTAEVSHVRRMVDDAHAVELLSGVWHSAGVLADGLLAKQSAWSLARVYAPKVHGGWSLHSSSMCTPLMASVLCSLRSPLYLAVLGKVNYSAANQCLDVLASHRRMQGRFLLPFSGVRGLMLGWPREGRQVIVWQQWRLLRGWGASACRWASAHCNPPSLAARRRCSPCCPYSGIVFCPLTSRCPTCCRTWQSAQWRRHLRGRGRLRPRGHLQTCRRSLWTRCSRW